MTLTSALSKLKSPFTESRKVLVKFGSLRAPSYTLTINGEERQNVARRDMQRGIEVNV